MRIAIQVHPGAKKNEIVRFQDEVWHIKIAAPPVEGKANQKLVEYLKDILDISKSRIDIEKGTTGRRKLVQIEGLTADKINARLTAVLK